MPPLAFAFGAMLAFATLGLLHKQADRSRCEPKQINILLFFCSSLLASFALLARNQPFAAPPAVWSIAIPSGFCAAVAILLFQIGIRHGKISSSWLIMNLSASVPVVASLLIYGEVISPRKAIALAAMLAALILLWLERRRQETRP
jgi:drug/metabolite transporter (DMT)-like permease